MATYVIGDIQGCCDSLDALMAQIPFRAKGDRLWFVGDLVNRGPKSLKTLRRIIAAGYRAKTVLGNHDLHLLALAAGVRQQQPLDTLSGILRAPDRSDLIDWLRHQPLAHADGNNLMIHAGVLPHWTLAQTLRLANEVSTRLRSRHWRDFLNEMVTGAPPHWADGVRGQQRLRAILNTLTRLRYLNADGVPDFKNKQAPATIGLGHAKKSRPALIPWFEVAQRKTARNRLIFGHWSTLGLIVKPNLISLDTGCVWGRQLTAVRLEDQKIYIQTSHEGRQTED